MIPTISDSPSEILKASDIFSFRIQSSQKMHAGPIPGLLTGYSEYHLRAVVLKIYKGALTETEGQEFRAAPFVYAGPILARPQGLWVDVTELGSPKPGDVEVAVCRSEPPKSPSAGNFSAA